MASDFAAAQALPAVSMTTGTPYTAPIAVSKTSVIRAIAYKGTEKTNVTIHTYIFTADVIRQSTMDQVFLNDPRYAPEAEKALKTIPSLHLRSNRAYPVEMDWVARPTNGTLEWLDPDNPSDNWSMMTEFDMFGGASRYYPKKNLRVHFRSAFGDDELEFPLFDGYDWSIPSSRRFKSITLRANSQDAVFGQAWGPVTYMKNIWHDWLMQDAGVLAPHARMAHLYYNLQYQGLYHVRERMGQHFFEEYLGMNKTDYDGINSGRVFDGDLKTWTKLTTSPTWASVKDWIDWESWLTYAVLTHYTGNVDLASHNWQTGGPHYPAPWMGKRAGWRMNPSDQDLTFFQGNPGQNTLTVGWAGDIFIKLMTEKHPDFLIKFQDKVYQMLLRERGVATSIRSRARFDKIMDEFHMNTTLIAEFGRWGNIKEDYWNKKTCCFGLADWKRQVDILYNYYLSVRTGIVIQQYEAAGWNNPVSGPIFNHKHLEIAEQGDTITINTVIGVPIIYTTNGEDPRLPGGDMNPKAIKMTSPVKVKVQETTRIYARAFKENVWGVMDTILVPVQNKKTKCPLCTNVIITEVMYHPPKPDTRIHFIEFKNVGTKPMVMTGAYLKGVSYTFPVLTLAPGQFWVIAGAHEDYKGFYNKPKYAKKVADDLYWGELKSGSAGDRLKFYDSVGNLIQDVEYDTNQPWSEYPDGFGYTLVPRSVKEYALIANDQPPASAKHWRHSTEKYGSPGSDDPAYPASRDIPLILNEVYRTGTNQWFEFYNPTTSSVDMSGWMLKEAYNDGAKDAYVFPKGTVIAAGQYFKITNETIGRKFAKDIHPAEVVLLKAACCRPVTNAWMYTGDYAEYAIAPQIPGYSAGYFIDYAGKQLWGAMAESTPAAKNSKEYRPSVLLSGYVNSAPTNKYRGLEFLRLTNYALTPMSLHKWVIVCQNRSLSYTFNNSVTATGVKWDDVLKPNQNLYVTGSDGDLERFLELYAIPRREPTAIVIRGYRCLTGEVDLMQYVPNDKGDVFLVDRIDIPPLKTTKRAEIITPSDMPTQFNRNPLGSGRDPKSWTSVLLVPPPVDCVWNDWGDWTNCSAVCEEGIRYRNRTRLQVELYGGTACPLPASQTEKCVLIPHCPVDCTWSEWLVDPCTVECGGGTRTSTRHIAIQADWGGKLCFGLDHTIEECNTDPCPVDCTRSEWSSWSSCTAECGGGTMTRTRTGSDALYGGECPDPALEDTVQCNPVACWPGPNSRGWVIAVIALLGVFALVVLIVLLVTCVVGASSSAPGADAYSAL